MAKRKKPELDDFAAWEERLRNVYQKAIDKRKARGADYPRQQPANAFKLAAYEYMVLVEGKFLSEKLGEFLDERDGRGWRRESSDSATAVMRLVSRYKKSQKGRKIRSRIAGELRFAWLNKVDPSLLLGFLYEAGSESNLKNDLGIQKRPRWARHYQLGPQYG